MMVPFQDWLTRLSSRGRNDMNPFVVGRSEYQKFLDVIEGCSRIALARRGLRAVDRYLSDCANFSFSAQISSMSSVSGANCWRKVIDQGFV